LDALTVEFTIVVFAAIAVIIVYVLVSRGALLAQFCEEFGRREVPTSVRMKWVPMVMSSPSRRPREFWDGLTRIGIDADFLYVKRLWPVDPIGHAVAIPLSALRFCRTRPAYFKNFEVFDIEGYAGDQLLVPPGILGEDSRSKEPPEI